MSEIMTVDFEGHSGETARMTFKKDFLTEKKVDLDAVIKEAKKQKVPPLLLLGRDHEIGRYFHNPGGPAMEIILNDKVIHQEFWLNGERQLGDKEEAMKQKFQFNEKLDKHINGD